MLELEALELVALCRTASSSARFVAANKPENSVQAAIYKESAKLY